MTAASAPSVAGLDEVRGAADTGVMIAEVGGPEPGLRERKRLATRRAIQEATVRLMSEHGFAGVTIDEISDAADVSPRTFFNYFPSKEAAVLGDPPTLPDGEVVEEFVAAGTDADALEGLAALLEPTVRGGEREGRDFRDRRRALLKDSPELFALKMAGMRHFEEELSRVVARRIARDDPALADDDRALAARARLVTYVATAAVRHAWSCWDERDEADSLDVRLRSSLAQLRQILA